MTEKSFEIICEVFLQKLMVFDNGSYLEHQVWLNDKKEVQGGLWIRHN
jgi:hypothetical protein